MGCEWEMVECFLTVFLRVLLALHLACSSTWTFDVESQSSLVYEINNNQLI